MVFPLIPLAIGGAGLLTGAGAYFGLKNQAPDVITTNQTTNNTSNITKKSSLVVEGGSNVGRVNFGGDSFTPSFRTEQEAEQSKGGESLLSNPLVLAGLGVGAYLIYKRNK